MRILASSRYYGASDYFAHLWEPSRQIPSRNSAETSAQQPPELSACGSTSSLAWRDVSQNLRTYTKAVYGFDAVVQRVADDRWDDPSPCAGWSARDVLGHNIGMCNMIAGFTEGVGATAPVETPPTDPQAQWAACRDAVMEALDTEGALQVKTQTPWGNLTVDRFIGIVAVDPLTHTFDLARATGQDIVLDEDIAAAGYTQLKAAGDAVREGGRFEPAADVADNASVVDKFVAMTGRRP